MTSFCAAESFGAIKMSAEQPIECKKFKPINSGTLQGFATLYIKKWGINIHNVAYHIKGAQEWINFPSKEFLNKEGEKQYLSYINFENKEHMTLFVSQATKAIKNFLSSEVTEIS